jgi:hypothetical protein
MASNHKRMKILIFIMLLLTGSMVLSAPPIMRNGCTTNQTPPSSYIIYLLGYSPATNTPTGITSALGYAPATNTSTGITSALGYAPATNDYNVSTFYTNCVLDFPQISAQTSTNLSVTVTGVVTNSVVTVSASPTTWTNRVIYVGFVTNINTVIIQAVNFSAAAINPPSGLFRVMINKML